MKQFILNNTRFEKPSLKISYIYIIIILTPVFINTASPVANHHHHHHHHHPHHRHLIMPSPAFHPPPTKVFRVWVKFLTEHPYFLSYIFVVSILHFLVNLSHYYFYVDVGLIAFF